MTNEERISMFVEEIENEAKAKKTAIEKDADAKIACIVKQGKTKIDAEAAEYLRVETEKLKNDYTKRVNEVADQTKLKLLNKRRELMDVIFSEIRSMMTDYVVSEKYGEYLKNALVGVLNQMDAPSKIFARSEDFALIRAIGVPNGAEIVEDDTIELGGIKAANKRGDQLLDSTLDAKLLAQYHWFAEHSGLIIS